jgi:hypothetical protein
MVAEWTDAEFAAETLASFPDKAIATVEEARVRLNEHPAECLIYGRVKITAELCFAKLLHGASMVQVHESLDESIQNGN